VQAPGMDDVLHWRLLLPVVGSLFQGDESRNYVKRLMRVHHLVLMSGIVLPFQWILDQREILLVRLEIFSLLPRASMGW